MAPWRSWWTEGWTPRRFTKLRHICSFHHNTTWRQLYSNSSPSDRGKRPDTVSRTCSTFIGAGAASKMLVIQNHPKEKLLLSYWDNATDTTDGHSSGSLSLLETSWATASQPNFASRTAELPSTSLSKRYGFWQIRISWYDFHDFWVEQKRNSPGSPDHLITFPNHRDFILYLPVKNSRFSWVAPLKTPEMLKCQLIIDSDQGGFQYDPNLPNHHPPSLKWSFSVLVYTSLSDNSPPSFLLQTPSVCSAFGLPLSLTLWVKRPWFSVGASGVEKTKESTKRHWKNPFLRSFEDWHLPVRIST